jgi:hypothetical protein
MEFCGSQEVGLNADGMKYVAGCKAPGDLAISGGRGVNMP